VSYKEVSPHGQGFYPSQVPSRFAVLMIVSALLATSLLHSSHLICLRLLSESPFWLHKRLVRPSVLLMQMLRTHCGIRLRSLQTCVPRERKPTMFLSHILIKRISQIPVLIFELWRCVEQDEARIIPKFKRTRGSAARNNFASFPMSVASGRVSCLAHWV